MYEYILAVIACVLVWYISSNERRNKLKAKWGIIKMLWQLSNGNTQSLLTPTTTSPATSVSFSICDTDQAALIKYTRFGGEYTYFARFQRRYVAKMSSFSAKLHRSNKDPLDITLQPGLAYEISPAELGGSSIVITNGDTGQSKVWTGNDRPGYAESLME